MGTGTQDGGATVIQRRLPDGQQPYNYESFGGFTMYFLGRRVLGTTIVTKLSFDIQPFVKLATVHVYSP